MTDSDISQMEEIDLGVGVRLGNTSLLKLETLLANTDWLVNYCTTNNNQGPQTRELGKRRLCTKEETLWLTMRVECVSSLFL